MKAVNHFFVALLSVLFFAACTVNNLTEDEKLGKLFEANKVTGTFGMFDNSRGDFTIYDLERFRKPVSPAQTFNIFSALVALHTGKLTDDSSTVIGLDSTSTALSLSSAFKNNSTTHFQTIAQLIGKDTLKYWMDSVKYGNKKIGNDINAFWLNDTLTISPDEQLGLIKRLYFKQHPFRASVQEQVKKMMVVVNNAQYQLAYQQEFRHQDGQLSAGQCGIAALRLAHSSKPSPDSEGVLQCRAWLMRTQLRRSNG